MCESVHMSTGPRGGRKKVLDALEMSYRRLCAPPAPPPGWVLKIELLCKNLNSVGAEPNC